MANYRGMGAVSWGQRKALRGIPYGTDPAYLLAQQQMQEEYNLMPERARLAEEKRQRKIQQDEAAKTRDAQGRGAMVSAGGNLGMMYYMGKSGMFGNPQVPSQVTPQAANTGTIPTQTPELPQGIPNTVPAVTEGITGEAGYVGMNALGESSGIGIESGMTNVVPSAVDVTTGLETVIADASSYSSAVIPSLGVGLAAGQLAQTGVGQDAGQFMMAGKGSRREHEGVAGGVGGALGGALTGAAATSWSGPGAIVGAVVGGIVGAASTLIDDSHICTATNTIVGMSEDEKAKMQTLKEYAIENHSGWWNSYFKHGPQLVLAITDQEDDWETFFKTIRLILIEPVFHEENIEKCFQIYLTITKILFKAYLPDCKFGEEE